MNNFDLYKKYFIDRDFERADLFEMLVEKYSIETVLYPGSFVHVTPSFFIPRAYYVDSDGGAKRFFADMDAVMAIINEKKVYKQDAEVYFFGQDYFKPLNIEERSIDLMVSQYAGPISQACKKYLKNGGILLANNSHADAGIASLDPDYRFIGVVNFAKGKHSISEKNLDEYFQPKKNPILSLKALMALGKGVGYTKTASSYLFERCG